MGRKHIREVLQRGNEMIDRAHSSIVAERNKRTRFECRTRFDKLRSELGPKPVLNPYLGTIITTKWGEHDIEWYEALLRVRNRKR